MPLTRSPAEIFGAFRDALLADVRKCVPATVTAVHADRQTVDVQFATNRLLFDDMGNAVSEDAPSLADVPLGVLRGGGFLVWVPVQVGDSVLLIFSDQSADTWRSGDGTAQDPGFVGYHTADSPFAIPAFAPDAKMLTSPNADPNKIIIGKDGSTAQIRLSDTDIELGAPAGDFVALASKVDSVFSTLQTWLLTHTHTAPAGGGPTSPPIVPPPSPSPTGSTLVKSG